MIAIGGKILNENRLLEDEMNAIFKFLKILLLFMKRKYSNLPGKHCSESDCLWKGRERNGSGTWWKGQPIERSPLVCKIRRKMLAFVCSFWMVGSEGLLLVFRKYSNIQRNTS